MASLEVERYKKSYEKIMDRWAEKVKKPLKELEEIAPEIAELEKNKDQSDDEKKRYKELTAQRKRCQEAVDKANMEMKLELSLIEPPVIVKSAATVLPALTTPLTVSDTFTSVSVRPLLLPMLTP